MPDLHTPESYLLRSFAQAKDAQAPYPHWLLDQVLPEPMIDAICALPFAPPQVTDTLGRRETHNSTRLFFGKQEQAMFPACATLATALQSSPCIEALQNLTSTSLSGCFLRLEYCQDIDGFWLEPHTDIGAKLFTMLIYLNDPPEGENWGTDIYETPTTLLGPAPSGRNKGLIFIPGHNSWHGFEKRHITGVRRSLIVNYVTPVWRARQELAFADQPIP